jgi:nucleotide-binding universal stress UspA family protein
MYQNILLTVDLNDEASWQKALPVAVEICQKFGSHLHVFTVVPDFGLNFVGQFFPDDYEQTIFDEAARRIEEFAKEHVPAAVACDSGIGNGTVYEVVLKKAKQVGADLVVIASHRPELKDYLLGPNAARVVRHAECSVLVVRD